MLFFRLLVLSLILLKTPYAMMGEEATGGSTAKPKYRPEFAIAADLAEAEPLIVDFLKKQFPDGNYEGVILSFDIDDTLISGGKLIVADTPNILDRFSKLGVFLMATTYRGENHERVTQKKLKSLGISFPKAMEKAGEKASKIQLPFWIYDAYKRTGTVYKQTDDVPKEFDFCAHYDSQSHILFTRPYPKGQILLSLLKESGTAKQVTCIIHIDDSKEAIYGLKGWPVFAPKDVAEDLKIPHLGVKLPEESSEEEEESEEESLE